VARLAVGRAEEQLGAGAPPDDVARSLAEVRAEIQRLDSSVQRFASFARLPVPELRSHDLGALVEEFQATFAAAWPGMTLERGGEEGPCPVRIDRPMIRQVLVNPATTAPGRSPGERAR
jgi:nitrogen fixation/metabolism regulation signal transduction histidine kinase